MLITDLQMVRPPQFCDDCGRVLIERATESDERRTQLLHLCPHHSTVIHTEHADIDNQRYITKWICETPCSDNRYLEMATALAAINRVGGVQRWREIGRDPFSPEALRKVSSQTFILR
jgi:hypothetical protein